MPLATMVIGAEKDGVVSRVAGGAESKALARHRSFSIFCQPKSCPGRASHDVPIWLRRSAANATMPSYEVDGCYRCLSLDPEHGARCRPGPLPVPR